MTKRSIVLGRQEREKQVALANQLKSAKMNFVQMVGNEEYNWNISKTLAKLGRPRRDFDTWMAEDDNFALAVKEQLDVIGDRLMEVSLAGALGELDDDMLKRVQWTQLRHLQTNLDKRFRNKTQVEVTGSVTHSHDVTKMGGSQLDKLIAELSGAEDAVIEVEVDE